ncbi:hypothetical protein [Streptomyces luteireticuli]
MDVAHRSTPQLAELLGTVDAVHGLHYVLMHLVGKAAGVSELTMRLPSAVAVAVAAGGLAWLGRLLGGPRLGLYAGLLLAVMPTASRYAQEARSFAFVMAVAVLTTGALVKSLTGKAHWPAVHAALIALLGWFNVMGLLLVAAHAATVALRRPGHRTVLRLLTAQAAGIAATVPLLLLGFSQRSAAGEAPIGLPWLAIPPLLLWLASLGQPLFAYRYLLFCLPARRPHSRGPGQALTRAGLPPAHHRTVRGLDITLYRR